MSRIIQVANEELKAFYFRMKCRALWTAVTVILVAMAVSLGGFYGVVKPIAMKADRTMAELTAAQAEIQAKDAAIQLVAAEKARVEARLAEETQSTYEKGKAMTASLAHGTSDVAGKAWGGIKNGASWVKGTVWDSWEIKKTK